MQQIISLVMSAFNKSKRKKKNKEQGKRLRIIIWQIFQRQHED